MSALRKTRLFTALVAGGVAFGGGTAGAQSLSPTEVSATLYPNGAYVVRKAVETPVIPPKVEVCLLEDETGSFADDVANLKAAASDIYDAVVAESPDAKFGVAGFRDYPESPYGSTGDWVYRLLSSMDPDKVNWLAGVNDLGAGGGGDGPEAQYDAIVAAVNGILDPTLGEQAACGFSEGATKVLVVTTDAPFHVPADGAPHVNDAASTLAVLQGAGVRVVGLKAPGAGGELDYLASETGGSVQALSSDGGNIAEAILAGLTNLEVEVSMTSDCGPEIQTAFRPASATVVSGDPVRFRERITVANDALPGTYECKDWVLINGEPMTDEAGDIIYEYKTITVLDGRMTGGGSLWFNQADGEAEPLPVRATHGMELHCASAVLPSNLQVNWKVDKAPMRFHLESLDYAKCRDSRRIDEENPEAGFDTIEGRGTGRLNNVPGATVRFVFTDAGEPGTEDSGFIVVRDADGNLVLKVRSKLDHGNHQAHPLP